MQRQRGTRGRFGALLAMLALILATVGVARPGVADAATRRPLLVLGFSGITWDDVTPDRMPRLTALAGQGGIADLVVRTAHATTCPVDGWLTLGAGARATGPTGACAPVPAPVTKVERPVPNPTSVERPPVVTTMVEPRWSDYEKATRGSLSGAHLGSLAATLPGSCALGPGAALALADPHGTTRWRGSPTPSTVAAVLAQCGTAIADIGDVSPGATRDDEVRALDQRVGALLDAAPGADVVAVTLADGPGAARLRPVVVRAAGLEGATLTSRSTRQPGIVLLPDITATLASLHGATPPDAWTGEPVTAGPAPLHALGSGTLSRLDAVRDLDTLAVRAQALAVPFFAGAAGTIAALCLLLLVAARLGMPGARPLAGYLLTALASLPAAAFLARLVPWWRSDDPTLTGAAVTGAIGLAVAALAWLGPWRRLPLGPLTVVALTTAAVIGGDVATGSHLTMSSLMGEHPIVGGRFYGLGNVASGLLATSVLLVMTAIVEAGYALGRTRVAAVIALLLGLGACAFVAAGQYGADFGGFAALVPAVVYLGLRCLGLRLDVGRLLVLGFITLGLLVAACLADWLRPPAQRTHLGRFAQSVIGGGGDDVIARKLVQNWDILTTNGATIAIPVVLLIVTVLVWRPAAFPGRPLVRLFRAVPLLRLGVLAVLLMLWIAFVVNDSGATVPVPVGIVVLPGIATAALISVRATRRNRGKGAARDR